MKHKPARKDLPVISITALIVFVISFLASAIYLNFFHNQPSPFKSIVNNSPVKNNVNSASLDNIHVPEPDENSENNNSAIPVSAITLSGDKEKKVRLFDIAGQSDQFIPNEIAAYENDIITIRLKAIDKKYDICIPQYGIKQEVEKGQTKIAQFQAIYSGTFDLLCKTCENTKLGSLHIVSKVKAKSQLTNSHLSFYYNNSH